MTGSLTLPALAFVAAISGLPGLKGIPLPASKELQKARAAAVAADTLPVPWKPSWRLALENQFVSAGLAPIGSPQGPIRLQPQADPRRVRVSLDPVTGTYRSAVEVGEVSVASSYRRPLEQFTVETSARTFRERWSEHARRNVNTLGKDTPIQRTGGLSLPIPVRLPQRLSSILGPGGPALNVSGSESIRLSGTSNWTNAQVGIIGQRQSLFPSLDLQQDLDIRLEGQLSDRIKVNLLQNSANQVPLANRIAINYRGDEDDFVQALDLGNTSLSLPGTQYVSYSGKNEGLFGVKLASRVGALDFTALASKQEGRSERAVYSGGGARSRYTFSDLDWVKGQYFLLYDPSFGTVYDVDEGSIRLYLDDGLASNDLGKTIPGKAVIDPDAALGTPLSAASDTALYRGNFDILNPGPDQQYEVLNNLYVFRDTLFKVIRLRQPIPVQSNQTLAVTYRATPIIGPGHQLGSPVEVGGRLVTTPGPDSGFTLMKLLRVQRRDQAPTSDGVLFDSTAAFAPVRELELKNVYNLGGFQIDSKSFRLTLQSGQEEPPVTDLGGIPFFEMIGIDSWDEQTAQPRVGHDALVDGIGFNSQTRGWVDYVNGTLFLPDPRPFAPRLAGPTARPLDLFLDAQLNRRSRLDGTPDAPNRPNPKAYDLYNPRVNDAQWYFTAEFAAARSGGGDITLGRGNILENSEAVVVNGERWTRDRDYTIDYDLGRITLKRQLGPSDQLSVDYSYAPLFAQASKTLVGSAFRFEGRDKNLGGAFLYESKGAQDLRPRLGEEPSRTLITDLNTEWRFKPGFLTRLADALPGVRTTTPSELNVQAEAGMSFPNPNTRNEVFVDDMEGVRDAVGLSLTPDRWRWSSVPRRATSVVLGNAVASQSFLTLPNQHNAEVHWFVPVNTRGSNVDNELIRERDLRPKLTDAQGGQNVRNVLSVSVPRTPTALTPGYSPGDTMWVGLTYNLDAVGLDLSRSQFIELWINDWNDHHDPAQRIPRVRGDGTPGSSVKLHIDLGRVSEDQMRAPNRPPNGRIDTEDQRPRDNQLTVTGDQSEDTGVDGITDSEEQSRYNAGQLTLADLVTASSSDPEGDDWGTVTDFPSVLDPRGYVATNGSERSKDAFPIPDTEDMNLDEKPDTTEAYFQYTIDLGARDSPYLVTDVLRDFASEPTVDSTRNGWRRYRIPLNDSLRVRFGFPDLTIAQHVRIWFEGLTRDERTSAASYRPMFMLGGFDIVGSRWLAADLTPRQRDTLRTALTLNAVNTVDNAEIYVAPFDPGTTRSGSQAFQRREQSIALEFTDLHPADTLEAFKTFSIAENYSRYGVLRWFAAGFEVSKQDLAGAGLGTYDPALDSLYYFVRFASDDKGQSYYEVKRRLPRSSLPQAIAWEEVLAEVEKLSVVKLDPAFPTREPFLYRTVLANGDSLILRGRPSFTRLLRVSFGVVNQASDRRFTGQLWFDELRATDVAKDVGLANRLLVNGRWANLMDYNLAWNSRDADFLSVGETRGSGSRTTGLNLSTRFEPHRFFEGAGIILPVTYSQNETSSRPRFTAGDDIVRSGALAEASETRSVSRVVSTSYSRVWNERSNPFLRYTVGGVTGNISRSTNDARSPTAVSKSRTVNAGVNYNIAPRTLLQVPMPFMKARFYPLPERVYWNYQVTSTHSEAFTRVFGTDSLRPSSSQNGRAASVDFGADTRPFDLLSHHVEGRRNLALNGVRLDRLGFINLGRVTSWRQSFASHLTLNPHAWVRPSFNWSSSYNQNNDIQSRDISARAISNGQEVGMNWELPFDRLVGTPGVSARPAPKPDSAKAAAPPRRPRLPWRTALSRLGSMSTDARLGRTSSYSRLSGTASPLYLVGLAENPGFDEGRVVAQPGNTASNGVDWRANARSNIQLVYGSSLQSRFSYGDRTNNNNGVKSRNRDWRFPDVEVQYGRVASLLGLNRLLESPQLRTAYARSSAVDYQNSRRNRTGTSRSDDFRPLFSIRGRLKNGTDADLRIERRSSVRESFQQGNSRQTDQTTDINFSLTRSYSQGQKVNVLGKTTTVRTNVSLALTTVYSRQKGGIKVGNEEKLANPIDRTRLSMNGTASYGFSTNVTGDLALGFSHFRETNGIIRRSVRVELRGQFRF
jgi:hypothetical protein